MATILFLLFYKFHFYSAIINTIAKYVFPVYLFENAAGLFIKTYIYNPDALRGSEIFLPSLLIYPFIVFAFCAIIAFLKNQLLTRTEHFLTDRIAKIVIRLFDWSYIKLKHRFFE